MSRSAPNRLAGTCLAVIAWLGLSAADAPGTPTAPQLRQWLDRAERVQMITRRILAANLHECPARHRDFGFNVVSRNPTASAATQAAWAQAIGLGDTATIFLVLAESPAQAAGLRAGDEVLALDGVPVEAGAEGLKRFNAAFAKASESDRMELTIRRDGESRDVVMQSQEICRAELALSARAGFNARARGDAIIVDVGLADMLDDDELAFVIGHEAAHVFQRHSMVAPDGSKPDGTQRKADELTADRLGLQFMFRAGFAPEAAARANPKIDRANRGPISRLLGLHGHYLPSRERTEFLARQAAELRSAASR